MRFLYFFHVCSFALLVIFLVSDLGMVSSASFPASRRKQHNPNKNVNKHKEPAPRKEVSTPATNMAKPAAPTPFGTAATNGTAAASGMAVAPLPSTGYFSFITESTLIKDLCGLFNEIHYSVIFFGLLSCVFSTAMLEKYLKRGVLKMTMCFPYKLVVKKNPTFLHSAFFGFITYRYFSIGFFLEKFIGLSFLNDATLKFLRGIVIYFFSGSIFYFSEYVNFQEYTKRCNTIPLIGGLVKRCKFIAWILPVLGYFAPFFAFVAFVLGGLLKFKKLDWNH